MMYPLSPISPSEHHNYVAFFLTFSCNLRCTYCINLHDGERRTVQTKRQTLRATEWIAAADRLILRDDLPLTLQGGEPTLHTDFFRIVNEVKPGIKMDLMTNLMFDVEEFIANVPIARFTREAPYAAIRASYHPGQNSIDDIIAKTLRLEEAGFRIGIYGILHPDPGIERHIRDVQERCLNLGIDFRTKEFLGEHDGRIYGTFKFPDCVSATVLKSCECQGTELIVDPSGNIYRCHADLYHARMPIGHILDPEFSMEMIDQYRDCDYYGDCNPCDVKVKTNRFQIFGHTSVEIRNIGNQGRERHPVHP